MFEGASEAAIGASDATSEAATDPSDAATGLSTTRHASETVDTPNRAKRDARRDMIQPHRESNHSMILHRWERKGTIRTRVALCSAL